MFYNKDKSSQLEKDRCFSMIKINLVLLLKIIMKRNKMISILKELIKKFKNIFM